MEHVVATLEGTGALQRPAHPAVLRRCTGACHRGPDPSRYGQSGPVLMSKQRSQKTTSSRTETSAAASARASVSGARSRWYVRRCAVFGPDAGQARERFDEPGDRLDHRTHRGIACANRVTSRGSGARPSRDRPSPPPPCVRWSWRRRPQPSRGPGASPRRRGRRPMGRS